MTTQSVPLADRSIRRGELGNYADLVRHMNPGEARAGARFQLMFAEHSAQIGGHPLKALARAAWWNSIADAQDRG